MQDTIIEVLPVEQQESTIPVSVLELPAVYGPATLQIVEDSEILTQGWLTRLVVEPILRKNADGLWLLTVRRQGEHGKFDVPYIGSEIILADAEMGIVVVLVSYHGTETYGPKRDKHVPGGQFYRYYSQLPAGPWEQQEWRYFNDEIRRMIIDAVEEKGPVWAKKPGKLHAERKPPSKPVAMTSYKVVRVIEGRYYSLYDPTVEYVLGQRMKQVAKPGHQSGYFSHPTQEMGEDYLTSCVRLIPFHPEVATPEVALLECEIGGRIINYGYKLCSTYLCPVRVIEVRAVSD